MQTYVDLSGPPAQVQARIAELEARQVLLALTPPRRCADGWRVRAWVRVEPPPHQMSQVALPGPPPPWRPPAWLTPAAAGRTAAVLAAVAVLVAVVWIVVRAVAGAVQWTQDHTGQLAAVLVAGGLLAVAWLARRLGRRGTAPTCTTIHGPGCRHH